MAKSNPINQVRVDFLLQTKYAARAEEIWVDSRPSLSKGRLENG